MNIGQFPDRKKPRVVRKPGRPRAIPAELEPVVVELYRLEYGYRVIARILRKEHGIDPNFSTVKRLLMRLNIVPHSAKVIIR